MSKVQAHIIFRGRVQGVGFRFTVERIAMNIGVVGWVKNLDEGNVEIIAEAEKDVLDDFLDRIRSYFARYIRDEEIDFTEASGKFRDFQIRF